MKPHHSERGSSSGGPQPHGDTRQCVGARTPAALLHGAGRNIQDPPSAQPSREVAQDPTLCCALCSLMPPPPRWGRRLCVTSHILPRPLKSGNSIKAVTTNSVMSVREVAPIMLLHPAVTATKRAKFLGEPEETVLPCQQASNNPAAHWC